MWIYFLIQGTSIFLLHLQSLSISAIDLIGNITFCFNDCLRVSLWCMMIYDVTAASWSLSWGCRNLCGSRNNRTLDFCWLLIQTKTLLSCRLQLAHFITELRKSLIYYLLLNQGYRLKQDFNDDLEEWYFSFYLTCLNKTCAGCISVSLINSSLYSHVCRPVLWWLWCKYSENKNVLLKNNNGVSLNCCFKSN